MSIATEFFLSFLPSLTSAASASAIGEPTKTMIRCRWFLFWRCLSASCATWMPAVMLTSPPIAMPCDSERILPTSPVSATWSVTPAPAIESTPTEFSGFDWHLVPDSRLTASCCASIRDGAKSPFRI